jgi:copper(I)-binding protein
MPGRSFSERLACALRLSTQSAATGEPSLNRWPFSTARLAPFREKDFIQIEGRFPMHKTVVMLATLVALGAQAQTTVKDPWVRGTVANQKATGMFAQITSASGGKLVSAASPVAGIVEIHEMAMDGNVMKMRAIAGLDLPAGKAVDLKPGGYHVMLMDLKKELKPGEIVPVTLMVEGADKKRETLEVKATVRPLSDSHDKKH